jgi:chromate transporter
MGSPEGHVNDEASGAGAAFVLGKRAIVDLPTILIAVVTLGVLFVKKAPEPLVIVAAGLVGLAVRWVR